VTGRGRTGTIKPGILPCLFFVFMTVHTAAQENNLNLPVIQRLDNRDTAFIQYISDVETARRQIYLSGAAGNALKNIAETLTVYSYTVKTDENILTLSAACNMPYSSIATINRISNQGDLAKGDTILLPSVPGLFIPVNPNTEFEFLLNSSRNSDDGILLTINNDKSRTRFLFLPGADFNPTERIFFLNRGFIAPLKTYTVSSTFGPRINPVTGIPGNHGGLDLAAPEGTPVYATREGKVSEQGQDPVLGNYIIISHGSSWSSVYGHLSEIDTVLNQQVNSGSLIGRVGSTGQSTGPHLHFELRQNGTSLDPSGILRNPAK